MPKLEIKNLSVSVEDKEIINKLNLTIESGTVVALMGPNGSGKSTLANVLLGHPNYQITTGQIVVDDVDLTAASPDQRAKAGLFLSLQYPPTVSGVSLAHFLRLAYDAVRNSKTRPLDFQQILLEKMAILKMDKNFASRSVNEGFSGGEKKRSEILQLLLLDPKYAILDETDSGLDVDALKIVAEGINKFKNQDKGVLLITHYQRLLDYVRPDVVHIMVDGKIVQSGGPELAQQIEENGYAR